jgi:hypothetical protein
VGSTYEARQISSILLAQPYSSRYTASLLFVLSSRAIRLFGPHLAFTISSFSLSSATFSGFASQHRETKWDEQLNLRASFNLVQFSGSVDLSLLISATSSSVRWCLGCFGKGLTRGGSSELEVEAVASPKSFRRLSSFGRNINGVWSTEGADAGGLNIIWSCWGDSFEDKKVESGGIFNFFLVRL